MRKVVGRGMLEMHYAGAGERTVVLPAVREAVLRRSMRKAHCLGVA